MVSTAITASTILLGLDFLWLWLYMNGQYSAMIPKIQGSPLRANMFGAVGAYSLMVLGLNMFVLPNIRKGHELEDSLKYGFTFGVVVYGIFDFTNLAVFEEWDLKLAMIDILWGGFVYFMASYFGSLLGN